MNVMMIGDICGQPGRHTAAHFIPLLVKQHNLDLVIANAENSAGGNGVTEPILAELLDMGIHLLTSGNHIWDKKEIFSFINNTNRLIRPANYPPGTPGCGYQLVNVKDNTIAVINLLGRTFMPPIDCPFRAVDEILEQIQDQANIILVDFHAEASSEKMALAWHLDGRVSCVVGTHTHIQTADDRILPSGTAYITDLGMVGPWNSVLGTDKEPVIRKFITGLPVKFSLAAGPSIFNAIIVTIDQESGKAKQISRIQEKFN